MFNRTKPRTLNVDLIGLGRLIRHLTEGEGLAQYAFRGEALHVREAQTGPTSGRFVVFLSREQTRYLLSRLPEVDLAREYDAPTPSADAPDQGRAESGNDDETRKR